MKPPLHHIVGVSEKATWRQLSLNEYADADFGAWMGKRQPKANPLLDPAFCGDWVTQLAKRKSVDYTWGGYMENRSTLWRGHYMKRGHFTHYGVDLNVPQGVEIYCPRPFAIHEVYHRADQCGGWGCRVVVETNRGLVVFAHLDLTEPLHPGRSYPSGYRLGIVAGPGFNGGWYPHLHLQGLRSLDLLDGLDGYGKRYRGMEKDYPNPIDILLPFPS